MGEFEQRVDLRGRHHAPAASLDDEVVPPNQAEMLAEAARQKRLPVALIMFDGEGHGFRRSETIKAATEAQIYFLGRILGFEPADRVPPVPIDNLNS